VVPTASRARVAQVRFFRQSPDPHKARGQERARAVAFEIGNVAITAVVMRAINGRAHDPEVFARRLPAYITLALVIWVLVHVCLFCPGPPTTVRGQ
jgi:hypothetical protein